MTHEEIETDYLNSTMIENDQLLIAATGSEPKSDEDTNTHFSDNTFCIPGYKAIHNFRTDRKDRGNLISIKFGIPYQHFIQHHHHQHHLNRTRDTSLQNF